MTLLEHYTRAVGLYLPRGPERADILAELTEHLASTLEEAEAKAGRPLTESEQQEILAAHGNPADVAARYGGTRHGFAFGRQVISRDTFPSYVIGLALPMTITIGSAAAPALAGRTPLIASLERLALMLLLEFIAITVVFAGIDTFWRWPPARRRYVSFPPPYRKPIPRAQSFAGLLLLGTLAVWWAMLPFRPALLLGHAAPDLELARSWHTFYWPLLMLLLVGITQRVITLAKPEWKGVQFFVRLCTNGLMLALVYPMVRSAPYVVVAGHASDIASATTMAVRFNSVIRSQLLTTGLLYWLFWTCCHAWLCIGYLRTRDSSPKPRGGRSDTPSSSTGRRHQHLQVVSRDLSQRAD